jgi:anthranilate phosphoribosyltransferase
MIREAIDRLVRGQSLEIVEAAQVMTEIMEGEASPAQLGAFLTALRLKGESSQEIAGMATTMRQMSLHVQADGPLVDTCGTGGDNKGTFNISTAAAFVAAGGGIKVAKHGNRAMSGACGSADVLEALGVKIDLGPNGVQLCIREAGVGFMFAPVFHPAMRHAAGPRREIGIRTIFNVLGPLTNPANAETQLIGVSEISLGEKLAEVLSLLGSQRALIAHGSDGADELTLEGITHVWELNEGIISSYTINAQELGLPQIPMDAFRIETTEDSAALLHKVLQKEKGPARDVVLLNAAAVFLVAGHVRNMRDGLTLAEQAIDSGRAAAALDKLIEVSQKIANQ